MILDILQIEIPEDKKIEVMGYLSELYHSGEGAAGSKLLLKPNSTDTAEEIAKEVVDIKKKIVDLLKNEC